MTADTTSAGADVGDEGAGSLTVREPAWVRHAVWWRVYPLGFVDAYPPGPSGQAQADQHRLLQLIRWLDHVVELGASGIALGPIFASSSHGYDTVDHRHIDPRLGGDDDFDALVTAAHQRGLRVQLDGVFNHVGRQHPVVVDAQHDGPGSLAAGWLRAQDEHGRLRLDTFEGHDGLVALNHDSPEVERHVVEVLRHWLDRGADAWRLDAAYAVPTDFWARTLTQVRRTHPDAWFEAEVIHGDYAGFVRDSTADTVTQYELWKATWSSINDRNFHELAWALQRHNHMITTFAPATFVGNHDVTRIASQIIDPRHLSHAIALLATLGGTPTIYAGDEYAVRGVKEHRAGGDDAIRPAFPTTGPDAMHDADTTVFRLHQRLIGLRRRHPWLHRATSETVHISNDQLIICLAEPDGHQQLTLALNLADHPLDAHGNILVSDDATTNMPGSVAPHGWAVLAPPSWGHP